MGITTSKGQIKKIIDLEEVVEDGEEVVAVVVPPEAEHLRCRVHPRDGELR